MRGTLPEPAPELLRLAERSRATEAVDVYSFGVSGRAGSGTSTHTTNC
jgi:hypothetical protein